MGYIEKSTVASIFILILSHFWATATARTEKKHEKYKSNTGWRVCVSVYYDYYYIFRLSVISSTAIANGFLRR